MKLLAYHGKKEIKQMYLDRLKAHRIADELIQGVGWEQNGTTKGCAVGCTLNAYDHARYETELGIPKYIARLEDSIFEGKLLDDDSPVKLIYTTNTIITKEHKNIRILEKYY